MIKKIKKVHFVGIKGVGMTPLAIIAKEAGFIVTGSDIEEVFITDVPLKNASITPLIGFSQEHVKNCNLIITTGAHGGFDNPEVVAARKLGIEVWSQGEAVGRFMNGEIFNRTFESVSVTGSHGKTTTTAIIATILSANNLDPTFVIGTGEIPSLASCGHYGKGRHFIAEADEYATEPLHDITAKFLWQKPKIGIITNVEFDHPDVYKTFEDLRKAFISFVQNMEENSSLIFCKDDIEAANISKNYPGSKLTYGFSKDADYSIYKISIGLEKMFFWVNAGKTSLGEFSLDFTGEHNALNALAAIVACLELGLSTDSIKKGLSTFKGTKRRLEFVGKLASGASMYDDYAHHPTEIKKTLIAIHKTYPKKQIVCIFQPHTFSRTKKFFDQFVSSFSSADEVIILDIFPSLRESSDNSVNSKMLSDSISRVHRDTNYIPNLDNVVEYVDQKAYNDDFVLVTMGAGDVYKIGNKLVKK